MPANVQHLRLLAWVLSLVSQKFNLFCRLWICSPLSSFERFKVRLSVWRLSTSLFKRFISSFKAWFDAWSKEKNWNCEARRSYTLTTSGTYWFTWIHLIKLLNIQWWHFSIDWNPFSSYFIRQDRVCKVTSQGSIVMHNGMDVIFRQSISGISIYLRSFP